MRNAADYSPTRVPACQDGRSTSCGLRFPRVQVPLTFRSVNRFAHIDSHRTGPSSDYRRTHFRSALHFELPRLNFEVVPREPCPTGVYQHSPSPSPCIHRSLYLICDLLGKWRKLLTWKDVKHYSLRLCIQLCLFCMQPVFSVIQSGVGPVRGSWPAVPCFWTVEGESSLMRSPAKYLAVLAVLLIPATAFAQATLTGTVRDSSGGVLPGVTVEAASPALIEKVRSAATDDTGQFGIVDLRPGTYTLTATLPGFVTVRRAEVELSGSQTLTIPIEMRVGGLEETITVTGETPVVDVQSARRELVLNADVVQAIPATRAAGALLNATPGVNVSDSGLAMSPTMTSFSARSSGANAGSVGGEGRYTVNGMTVSAARSGGHSSYVYDTVNTDEVSVTVGGGLGETDIGGPVMNIIPRSGGNNFSGSAFTSLAGDWSRGDNLTSEIQALNPNLQQTPGIINAYDSSISFGGPIKRDRLWFYGSFRDLSTQTAMEGINANANAGDPSRWDWVGAPIEARLVQDRRMIIGRMTGQFERHRIRFNSEYQHRCEGTPLRVETQGCHNRGVDWVGLGNNTGTQMSPEATSTAARGYFDVPFYMNQFSWSLPATNRLLIEAGYQPYRFEPIFGQPSPDAITGVIPVTEQSNAINPATGLPFAPVANYRYRAVESWGPAKASTDDVQANVSYVTGAHS